MHILEVISMCGSEGISWCSFEESGCSLSSLVSAVREGQWMGLKDISGCGLEGISVWGLEDISGCGPESISGWGPESISGCGPEGISRDDLQMCPQQKPSRGVSGGIGDVVMAGQPVCPRGEEWGLDLKSSKSKTGVIWRASVCAVVRR